jgi:hypothetical protein
MSAAISREKRRWPRLQFSLRVLLLALTVFAVGFPIWYRWPYEEEVWESPPGLTPKVGRITTWQRQWGGGRLQQGRQQFIVGDVTTTMYFVDGKRHGPFTVHDAKGRIGETGQYVGDLKEGVWTATRRGDKTTANYHRGKLDGKLEMESSRNGNTVATFAAGRLTHVNGQPVKDRVFDLVQSGRLDERTAGELGKDTEIDIVEMPLKDVVEFLSDRHGIAIALEAQRLANVDLPLTGCYSGVDLASLLALLTAPNGMGCDYRYGRLCITTAEDAENWHDPTGVAEIMPPKDSALARAWNESVAIDVVSVPLADAVRKLVQRLAIEIDTTQVEAPSGDSGPVLVTAWGRDLPFRHVLGIVLYNCGCRCKLEGEQLVILSPESDSQKNGKEIARQGAEALRSKDSFQRIKFDAAP